MAIGNQFNALLLCIVLVTPIPVLADYHYQKKTDEISVPDLELAGEITAFLAEYEEAYNNQDYRKVKSMWLDDGNPIYMAEEVPFPLYGKERIDNYFNPVPGRRILDGIDNKYSQVRAKYVTPDIAVATYRLDYDIKLSGMAASHGWNRVMAVFVRNGDDWKLTAYTEAPMGPATMVRKMMQETPATSDVDKMNYSTTRSTIKMLTESSVSPDFDEFLEARKDLEPTY
ncbi:MAG: nuclear transport factor 2 family protein [Gammaproteobacteria bacterium]|jgi:ketosteroid isomerase-like protein